MTEKHEITEVKDLLKDCRDALNYEVNTTHGEGEIFTQMLGSAISFIDLAIGNLHTAEGMLPSYAQVNVELLAAAERTIMEKWVLRIGTDADHSIDADGVYGPGDYELLAADYDDAFYKARSIARKYLLQSGITVNLRFYCVSRQIAICFDAAQISTEPHSAASTEPAS